MVLRYYEKNIRFSCFFLAVIWCLPYAQDKRIGIEAVAQPTEHPYRTPGLGQDRENIWNSPPQRMEHSEGGFYKRFSGDWPNPEGTEYVLGYSAGWEWPINSYAFIPAYIWGGFHSKLNVWGKGT
jgi:hypothetical protein